MDCNPIPPLANLQEKRRLRSGVIHQIIISWHPSKYAKRHVKEPLGAFKVLDSSLEGNFPRFQIGLERVIRDHLQSWIRVSANSSY